VLRKVKTLRALPSNTHKGMVSTSLRKAVRPTDGTYLPLILDPSKTAYICGFNKNFWSCFFQKTSGFGQRPRFFDSL